MPNGGVPHWFVLRPKAAPGLGLVCFTADRMEVVSLNKDGTPGGPAFPPFALDRAEVFALLTHLTRWVEDENGEHILLRRPTWEPSRRDRVDYDFDW